MTTRLREPVRGRGAGARGAQPRPRSADLRAGRGGAADRSGADWVIVMELVEAHLTERLKQGPLSVKRQCASPFRWLALGQRTRGVVRDLKPANVALDASERQGAGLRAGTGAAARRRRRGGGDRQAHRRVSWSAPRRTCPRADSGRGATNAATSGRSGACWPRCLPASAWSQPRFRSSATCWRVTWRGTRCRAVCRRRCASSCTSVCRQSGRGGPPWRWWRSSSHGSWRVGPGCTDGGGSELPLRWLRWSLRWCSPCVRGPSRRGSARTGAFSWLSPSWVAQGPARSRGTIGLRATTTSAALEVVPADDALVRVRMEQNRETRPAPPHRRICARG